MKTYYFPPAGFGFWYQLGMLENIDLTENNIIGSSAGSLICLVSILDKKDRNINDLLNIANDIKNNLTNNKLFDRFNLFNYTDKFIIKLLNILEKYPERIISERLKKILIKVTYIKMNYLFIPNLKNKIIKPKNLKELRDLVNASCYIPFFSYNKNPLFYEIKKKKIYRWWFLKITKKKLY